ncbi:hypothetical protein ACQ0MK_18895 [Thalassospira lucentensis]|uniref:hypothetical protein n=1 Tax=Thalassospira lucentensis TaxID=168935 RepID=UPI003D2EA171
MAGFWSMVGLVIKSLITGNETVENDEDTAEEIAAEDTSYVYAIARFSAAKPAVAGGPQASDQFANLIAANLTKIPESRAIRIEQYFSPNPDAVDPFQAMREAQLVVLNTGKRADADAIFWGQQDPATGDLDVHLVSEPLVSSLYDLMLPMTYVFKQPDHPDVAEALRILLAAALLLQSRGGEQRLLHISRLSSCLENFQDRINQGDKLATVGSGVAIAYAFGVFMLTETGDRSYCASALKVLEPQIRRILTDAGDAPTKEVAMQRKASAGLLGEAKQHKEEATNEAEVRAEDLIARISDFSKINARSTAVLALYGGLANWSLIGSLKSGTGAVATGIWQLLERRFEQSVGSPVACALAICKLGEAMVASGKDAEDAKMVDNAGAQYRRALGMINNRTHAPLYSLTAYGLAESIVTSAAIKDVSIPDTQVVPVFQAALKVCARRDHPYIWGRIMFALATVQLTNGASQKDMDLLTSARRGFSQAYEAFGDAGAKGAARAASGGYARSENTLSQLGHLKAVMDATGGDDAVKAPAS